MMNLKPSNKLWKNFWIFPYKRTHLQPPPPAFFELDRNDKSVPDINLKHQVSNLDSASLLKLYFSRLSNRNDKGNVYCSVILAQNISFHNFMDKARLSLANLEYGLFPKASDHEETAEIGWLFYSVRQQDEERLSEMISCLVNEMWEWNGDPSAVMIGTERQWRIHPRESMPYT